MAVKSVKIVPSFPSGAASAAYKAGGASLLGAKGVMGQMASMRRASTQADIANAKLGLESQKVKLIRSKIGNQNMGKLVTEFNKFNTGRSRENLQREKYGLEPLPFLSFNQYLSQFYGIASGNPLTGEFSIQEDTGAPTPTSSGQGMVAPAMGQPSGAMNPLLQMARKMAISNIPTSNQGTKIRGYAEGGIANNPQLAVVGEKEKEYIVPESKLNPQTKAELEKVLSAVPEPKKVVSERLPTLQQLISTLDEYDTAEQAINDLVALDKDLGDMGLDILDVEGIEQFLEVFRKKFGDQAAEQLVQLASSNRGGGQ